MKTARTVFIFTVGIILVAIPAFGLTVNTGLRVDATLTADNHYALYTGHENGTGLNFVGKSEVDDYDPITGKYSWETAESWTFDLADKDYIYVVAWSDDDVAQGWLGQFTSVFGTQYSNESDWEFIATEHDLDSGYDWGANPTDEPGLAGFIAAATLSDSWLDVTFKLNNGDAPWGPVTGIDAAADWIWGGSLSPGADHGEYLVFRTQLSGNEVPEPATMLLMGLGLAGLAGVRRRKGRDDRP